MVHPSLRGLNPTLKAWFMSRFLEPTDIQVRAWPSISRGDHTLIASPTGSGKTLAALIPCLHSLVTTKMESDTSAEPGIRLLYVAPLKALNNDIHDHLKTYFEEISEYAALQHLSWPHLRVAVRTGDTTRRDRTALLREPADILMTTPESLYILLTTSRGQAALRTVTHVVVDEIHDLASSKRGTHLSLSLERLAALTHNPPVRIGVSATQRPLSRVAQFLGGWNDDSTPRRVEIVESHNDHHLDIAIVTPETRVERDQDSTWTPMVQEIISQTKDLDRFMVFVNNRRLCERLTLRINDHVGYEMAKSHHGSISKEARLSVEQSFKSGVLRCIVATSSLELGIDIGDVDLVIQVDSPKSPAIGIQRFGRAGHSIASTSRGLIIAKNRNQLAEIAVLRRMMLERDIDEIQIPRHCLDVLTQHVVSMVTTEDWNTERLHELICRSDAYLNFPLPQFESMLRVISGYFPFVTPLINYSSPDGTLRARPNTQLSALLGAGTIPQSTDYPVYDHVSGIRLGELDEEFVHESRAGDVFQLGASSWMIRSIRHDRVSVVETSNHFSEIPFWKGESTARSQRLGERIGTLLLSEVNDMPMNHSVEAYLQTEWGLDDRGAQHLAHVLVTQKQTSSIPTHQRVVIEHYKDDVQQTHVIVHCLFGRRLNRTWALALEDAMRNTLSLEVYTNVKDNGIQFVFPKWDDRVWDVFHSVTANQVEDILLQAIPKSPLFSITLRRTFETALLFSRRSSRTPVWLKRLRTEELLKQAIPYANTFPFIHEALKECMDTHLDVRGVKRMLEQFVTGDLTLTIHELVGPSPLAREFLAEYFESKLYESDVMQWDVIEPLTSMDFARIKQELELDETPRELMSRAIEEQRERLSAEHDGRFVHDEETLYRWFKRVGDVTAFEIADRLPKQAQPWLERLVELGRIVKVELNGEARFICEDEHHTYQSLTDSDMSIHFVLSRWMEQRVAFTSTDILARYPLDSGAVTSFLDASFERGYIEPSPHVTVNGPVWISSRVAERIRRKSVGSARNQYSTSVSEHDYVQLMLRHHRIHPLPVSSTGLDRLRQAIDVLQGIFMTPREWETMVLPSRVPGYRKEDLDLLCATGEVFWVGRQATGEKEGRVTLFSAQHPELYQSVLKNKLRIDDNEICHKNSVNVEPDVKDLELLQLLERQGATFVARLGVQTGLPPLELLHRLFKLAWSGLVSNDQFSPLRIPQSKKASTANQLKAGVGRWYAISSLYVGEQPIEKQMVAWAEQLVKRHGIVAKVHATEHVPYTWDDLKRTYEHMENVGRVVRGLHVRSIPSIQFAPPLLLSQLKRGVQHDASNGHDRPVLLSSLDPANPYGIAMSWPKREDVRFSRKAGNSLVFYQGRWLLWLENGGRRVTVIDADLYNQWIQDEADIERLVREVFTQVFRMQGIQKTTIELWCGEPIVGSAIEPALRKLGAQRQDKGLVLWKIIV